MRHALKVFKPLFGRAFARAVGCCRCSGGAVGVSSALRVENVVRVSLSRLWNDKSVPRFAAARFCRRVELSPDGVRNTVCGAVLFGGRPADFQNSRPRVLVVGCGGFFGELDYSTRTAHKIDCLVFSEYY